MPDFNSLLFAGRFYFQHFDIKKNAQRQEEKSPTDATSAKIKGDRNFKAMTSELSQYSSDAYFYIKQLKLHSIHYDCISIYF